MSTDDVPFHEAITMVLEAAINDNVVGHTWSEYTYALKFRARRCLKTNDIQINNVEMMGPISVIDNDGKELINMGSTPKNVMMGDGSGTNMGH